MKNTSAKLGFTLIELMSAMATLIIMIMVLAQLIGMSSNTVLEGRKRVDNFQKVRTVLDLFALDLRQGVFRKDVAAFRDNNAQQACVFYAQRGDSGQERQLSLIAYRLTAEGTLQRAQRQVEWNDIAGLGFDQTNVISRCAEIVPADYQTVATGVLGMQIYFVTAAGGYQQEYGPDCRAVGIAVAVVDDASLGHLNERQKLAPLMAQFTQQTPVSAAYREYWGGLAAREDVLSDVPATVRPGIRVFERYFPIPQ